MNTGNRVQFVTLTAFVESVQPVNIILAHLCGLAKGHVAVRNGLHGGKVVLGEGIPEERQVPHRQVITPNTPLNSLVGGNILKAKMVQLSHESSYQ